MKSWVLYKVMQYKEEEEEEEEESASAMHSKALGFFTQSQSHCQVCLQQ